MKPGPKRVPVPRFPMPEWVTGVWWERTLGLSRSKWDRRRVDGLTWDEAEHLACKKHLDPEDIWPGFNRTVDAWTDLIDTTPTKEKNR